MIKKYSQYINESKKEDLGGELIEASKNGDLTKVKELIDAGADINYINSEGDTALIWGSYIGDLKLVKELIRLGADVNVKDYDDYTPLMWASKKGCLEIVKELIKAGADVNNINDDGYTALIMASNKGFLINIYLEIIKELIKAGADLFIKDDEGKSFMDYYSNCPGLKTFEFQDWLCSLDKINFLLIPKEILHPDIENKYKELSNVDNLGLFESKSEELDKELIDASSIGDLNEIKKLIKSGADVNIKDDDGDTPLINASALSYLELVKELIKLGADVNSKNYLNQNALIFGSLNGDLEIVKELIKSGADLNIKDKYGDSALIWASNRGYLEVVKELIKAGADLFIKNKDGKTFMDYYKKCQGLKTFEFQDWLCSLDKINFLLIPKEILHPEIEKKYKGLSNVDNLGLFESKSDIGNELIHASSNGELIKVKELIKSGVDVNKTDNGYTALLWASWQGHLEVLKELIKAGADINFKTNDGNSSLIVATWDNRMNIIKELINSGADLLIKNNIGKTFIDYYDRCPGLKTFEFQDWLCSLDKINFLLIPKEILHPKIEQKYKGLSNVDQLGLF